MTVEPHRLELAGRPGEPLIGEIYVHNDRPYAVVVTATPDRYQVVPFSAAAAPVDPPSCTAWIGVPPAVEIAAGETAPIRYQIAVPTGVTQEHVGAIRLDVDSSLAGLVEPSVPGQGRLQVTLRVSIPVYVAIEGHQQPAVAIERLEVAQAPGERRLRIGIGLVNVGLTHARPFGHLTIMNEDRRVVAHLPIGRSLPLLAGQRGEIPLYWKPEIPGRYTAVAVINVNDALVERQQMFLFQGWP